MKEIRNIVIIIIFIIGVIKLIDAIENNDDWAPYTLKKNTDEYIIQSDLYNLREVKKEVTEIADKYEKEIKLTYIEYYFEGENKGKVKFKFYRDDYNGKNKACVIDISVDLETKNTTEILYEKGHGKRVSGHSSEIINTLDENILDYIDPEIENYKIIVNDQYIRVKELVNK